MADVTPHLPYPTVPEPKADGENPRTTDNTSKPKDASWNVDANPRETGYGTSKK